MLKRAWSYPNLAKNVPFEEKKKDDIESIPEHLKITVNIKKPVLQFWNVSFAIRHFLCGQSGCSRQANVTDLSDLIKI